LLSTLNGALSINLAMPEAWSQIEVEATVEDYFSMLDMELRDQPYNKAEHNRALQRLLNNRSHGSVERKHQNISAIVVELGYPYIDGYKPLGNYQELLRIVVEERLSQSVDLNRDVKASVEERAEDIPDVEDILSIQVDPPVFEEGAPRVAEKTSGRRHGMARKNYLEIEARNQSLGLAGEEFILRFEHERLDRAKEPSLAKQIRHVAALEGDQAGYDVLSFETDGRKRLIEVKTTRFGQMTPFFASHAEVDFSRGRGKDYQLYRLYSFKIAPKLYVLPGSLNDTCRLNAITFSALPV
jgi:uncharacterized protein DUF3883